VREQQPMTQTIQASQVRQRFSQLLNQVFRKEWRVLVEKSGVPVAAIVSADDLVRLTQFDEERAVRGRLFDRMRAAFDDVPECQIERDVAYIIEQERQRRRSIQSTPTTG